MPSKSLSAVAAVGVAIAAATVPAADTLANVIVNKVDFGSRGELYNNSGLSFALNDGDPVPGTMPTHATEIVTSPVDHDNDLANHFWAASTTPGQGDFNFDEPLTFVGLYLWNYNVVEDQGGGVFVDRSDSGVSQFAIWYRDTADGMVKMFDTFHPAQADEDGDTPAQFFSFGGGGLVTDRLLFRFEGNFGGTGTGLGELRFVAVPEPGALGLGVAGALLMLGHRRR